MTTDAGKAQPQVGSRLKAQLQVGGTLDPSRHLYIKRCDAEDEVFRLLRQGEYCNILCPRQVGKSSLMVNTVRRLRGAGIHTATVDTGTIGSPKEAAEWYRGVLSEISEPLGLEVDIERWWAHHGRGTPNQRLLQFFREQVCIDGRPPCVVFLDEIDTTLGLDYTDDFFTAIRSMYNDRSTRPDLRTISFCLIGVASANELIKRPRTTPYNVGRTIALRDFDPSQDDLAALAEVIDRGHGRGQALLDRVLHWTGGQPYLTLRLCQEIIERELDRPNEIDTFIDANFCAADSRHTEGHFKQIEDHFSKRIADKLAALRLYERIIKGRRVRDEATSTHIQLKLSGLVKRDRQGRLVVRNRIYEQVFNRRWVQGSRPVLAVRRWRRIAVTASLLLVLLVGGLGSWIAYDRLILEPPRRVAQAEMERLSNAVDEQAAFQSYRYLASLEPHPELERQILPVPSTLIGYRPQADVLYRKILFGPEDGRTPTDTQAQWLETWIRFRRQKLDDLSPEHIEGVLESLADMERRGLYRPCWTMIATAAPIIREARGREDPLRLRAEALMGLVALRQGIYTEAERVLRDAHVDAVEAHGFDHPMALRIGDLLGTAYRLSGDDYSAEELLDQMVKTRERIFGRDSLETLGSASRLAEVYFSQERYDEAEPLFQRAFDRRREQLGIANAETLESMNNLGRLLTALGRYEDAEPLLQDALEARERLLGPRHPQTLSSLEGLAHCYEAQGAYVQADSLYRRALEQRRKELGAEHPETLSSMIDLALSSANLGNSEQDQRLYSSALDGNKRARGQGRPITLEARLEAADFLLSEGFYQDAVLQLRRIAEVRLRADGPEHQETITVIQKMALARRLAELYVADGRRDLAANLMSYLLLYDFGAIPDNVLRWNGSEVLPFPDADTPGG